MQDKMEYNCFHISYSRDWRAYGNKLKTTDGHQVQDMS